jgi:endonuclease-3
MGKKIDKFLLERKRRARKIFKKLEKLFPDAGMILDYSNDWELMVAVQLSAQSTDRQVNKITPALFKKYPRIEDYANARPSEFERDIFSSGFYKAKTRNILGAAKYLLLHHQGRLPKTMAEMVKIPGVGRKTANVVLGNAHRIVEGIAVDTHVRRLAQVLGLTKEKTPEKIEKDLMSLFPQKDWFRLTYLLIEYGRNYCVARKHDHEHCPLYNI